MSGKLALLLNASGQGLQLLSLERALAGFLLSFSQQVVQRVFSQAILGSLLAGGRQGVLQAVGVELAHGFVGGQGLHYASSQSFQSTACVAR